MESTALGFTAGFAGRALEEMLRERGIVPQFIRLSSGETRINVKLRDNRRITEINACGPNISAQALEQLFDEWHYILPSQYGAAPYDGIRRNCRLSLHSDRKSVV